MTTQKVFRWFWAWDDEKEEAWLRGMAQQGWHLQAVTFPGRYHFEQGTPRDDVYRLDFFTEHRDKAAYLQLFHDAGWEHVEEYGSWEYFRKEAVNGEAPEIFTDPESKIKKYQRLLLVLAATFPIWSITINRLNEREGLFFQAIAFMGFLLILFYIYAIMMLLRRINQLRHL